MVILPPVKPGRITKVLKPYVLKMHFSNKYVSAQVIHGPTATTASAASSQEKALRSSMQSTGDVAAAAKIGKILGERLLTKLIAEFFKDILRVRANQANCLCKVCWRCKSTPAVNKTPPKVDSQAGAVRRYLMNLLTKGSCGVSFPV